MEFKENDVVEWEEEWQIAGRTGTTTKTGTVVKKYKKNKDGSKEYVGLVVLYKNRYLEGHDYIYDQVHYELTDKMKIVEHDDKV